VKSLRRSTGMPKAALLPALLLMACMLTMAPQRAEARQAFPWKVTGVVVNNGQLFALINLKGATRIVPLHLGAHPSGSPSCPILDLQVGAIDLTLLGLRVQTSEICLQINAQSGGGLLGNLLCQVARLLKQGLSLSAVLETIGPQQTNRLLSELAALIQAALNQVTSAGTLTSQLVSSCQVLHLELGPIDLNLLGLMVHLDNCHGGPITVDITAIAGGGLLGDLLCNPSNLLLTAEALWQLLISTILGL
jgi:hypothetical protein